MNTEQSIVCKLGGYKDSHPEIISSYPELNISMEESKQLLLKCLPIGSQVGDFVIDRHDNHNLISYVFKNKEEDFRDDLISFSIILDKKLNIEIYKRVILEFFKTLEKSRLLSEYVLKEYEKSIFQGLNEEIEIEIEHIKLDFANLFKTVRNSLIKPKPKMKGSFF